MVEAICSASTVQSYFHPLVQIWGPEKIRSRLWHYFSTMSRIPVLLWQRAPRAGLEKSRKMSEEGNRNVDMAGEA